MPEHKLDALLRPINPATFSEVAHGPGQRVVFSPKTKASLYEPGLLNRLFASKEATHYFVKRLSTPLRVDSWKYHWSEGTSAISLDFDATFEIRADDPQHARRLVEALHSPEPGEALYQLINRHLHEALTQQLQECKSRGQNLLARFRDSSVGVGESDSLNTHVGSGVSAALGGVPFRIGFQLRNSAPMQVEVRQDDKFRLADSDQPRNVVTTALLELQNYQTFKKTGLETEAAVRATIAESIRQAVKRHLFARKYFDIVKSAESIESLISKHIEEDATRIGYSLNMFQIFPDIAALALLDWKRVELPAKDFKYRPQNTTSYVQMDVAIQVRARDFDLLHRLIDPDETDILAPIRCQVHQLCQDQIQRIGRMEFNLQFKEKIFSKLSNAIVTGLAPYGLACEVLSIAQAPTEEATRFRAVCARSTPFSVEISPDAQRGQGEPVVVQGHVQVTGMSDDGWEMFERKDFGFRSDSDLTDSALRQQASIKGVQWHGSQTGPLSEAERRQMATSLELLEIRDRVVAALRQGLSTQEDLAGQTRTSEGRERLATDILSYARAAIHREFGLVVDVYGIERGQTLVESLNQRRTRGALEAAVETEELERQFVKNKLVVYSAGTLENLRRDLEQLGQARSEIGFDPEVDAEQREQRIRRQMADSTPSMLGSQRDALKMLSGGKPAPASRKRVVTRKGEGDGEPKT